MGRKRKWMLIALIELLIILTLGIYIYAKPSKNNPKEDGLLSQRVYAGVLEPESLLIFNLEPLEQGIEAYLSKKKDITVGVYITNLRDGASLGINEQEEFEPASLNKLPLAILVMRQIERGALTLQTPVKIKPEDTNAASGDIYQASGATFTVDELLHKMLAESDNTAFNALNRLVNESEWSTITTYLNYYDIRADSRTGTTYTTTPEANAHIFTSLYLSTLLRAEHSEYILAQLVNSSFDIRKEAHIPSDVTIAQKFGTYYKGKEKYFHSCGIMYIESSRFFYCVMTKGAPSAEAENVVGDIVNALYRYVIETKRQTREKLL